MKDFNLEEYTRQVLEIADKYKGNQRFFLVANLIAEAFYKGCWKGHNACTEIARNAVQDLEQNN